MSSFLKAAGSLCFTFLLFPSTTVSAQEKTLEAITVTASRTDVSLQETGSSISIIDREAIVNSNAISVSELLRSVPGLHINQQGSKGAVTQLRVRGAEANHVLVLIDGVEANDVAQAGEFNFTHLLTDQIERIEVVRGPQSALWGSDALAGVVNIITIADNDPGERASVIMEAGSFGSQRAGASWQQQSGTSLIKLGLNHFETDGTNISRVGSEEDGYKNTTASASVRWFLTDNAQIDTSLRYTETETEFDGTDFVTTGLPVDASNVTDSDQFYARMALNLDSFDGQYQQTLSFSRTDTDNQNDTGNLVDDTSRGELDRWLYQGDLYFGQSILSVVAEYETIDFRQRGPIGFGNPNKDLDTNNKSLAFEYRFNGDRWDLSASARHDNNSDFDDSNTYRVTAAWETPIPEVRVFSSYGKAIKNPTFTDRFGFFDNFIGNPDLEPEQSKSWEVGLRHLSSDAKILASVSYFSSELEDEINGFVFDPVSGGFTANNIDGDSSRQGVEVEVEWAATEQLDLHGSYSYIDSTSEDATGRDTDEVRRPRNTAALAANYHFGKANLNLSAVYNGSQLDDFFPPFPTPQARVNLDSFTLLNFAGSYQLSDQLVLTMRLENLLDEDYEEVFGYASPGFAAYGGIRYQW